MRTDIVVVHCPVGGGHKAAALATAEAARVRGLSVEVINAFEHAPRWAGDAYVGMHLTGQRTAPEIYGRMYEHANRRAGWLEPLRLGLDNAIFGQLARRVRALAPRAVIATHHLPLVVLGRARSRGELDAPVTGIVTDYTAHACWAERGIDAWTVPCRSAALELAAHGVAAERIFLTGIPTREAFARVPPLDRIGPNIRVLVTSGAFGVGPLPRVVDSLTRIANAEVTIVCGADTRACEQLRRSALPGVRVLGFEKDVAARMAEAHVVVGKAGGLTVTEALVAGRPLVVTGAVPGNETQNERFVVEGGAGVAARPDEVGRVIATWVRDGTLPAMGARARALVPGDAAQRVLAVARYGCHADRRIAA